MIHTTMPCRSLSLWTAATLVLFTSLSIGAARRAEAQEAAATQSVPLPIVSIGGDVTEIIYALGKADAITAVDTTSVYPPDALKTKKNVGYMRALSTEGVLSTGAMTIIASDRAGPPEVVAALKNASITFHEIKENNSPEGIAEKIKTVGSLVGKSQEADAMAARTTAAFAKLATLRTSIPKKKKVLFVLAVQDGRVTVGGRNTSADAILALAGAENAAAGVDGFKPVTDEQLVAFAPEAVVVMKRPGLKSDPVEDTRNLQGLSASPAVAGKAVFGMDGQYVLGFGPRAPDAATDLLIAIYPDLAPLVKAETR